MEKRYYEIDIQPKRETTFEEDKKRGIYDTVVKAMLLEHQPGEQRRREKRANKSRGNNTT
jgi:hypothetical protein